MAKPSVHPPITTGQQFHRWLVIGPGPSRPRKMRGRASHLPYWLCRCLCGTERAVAAQDLRSGRSQSCGCRAKEIVSAMKTIHGAIKGGAPSPEYTAWCRIRARCENPKGRSYSDYGGRGIFVCERWRAGEGGTGPFECFLADMGPRPSASHSIDRYPDNDGPYAPWNCRWATPGEQARNRRSTVLLMVEGVPMCMRDAAEATGVGINTVTMRKRRGEPKEAWLRPPWTPLDR